MRKSPILNRVSQRPWQRGIMPALWNVLNFPFIPANRVFCYPDGSLQFQNIVTQCGTSIGSCFCNSKDK